MFPSLSAIEIQNPNIKTENIESDFFSEPDSRQSPRVEIQNRWNDLVIAALSVAQEVDPFQSDLPAGTVLKAVDALGWSKGHRNCDIRPRLVDKVTGEVRLLDSGSQISVTKRRPEDKVDNSIRLIAVNGSKIETFGVRNIDVKLGRKLCTIPAIICEVQQDILGMDFIEKFKLNLEWDENEELNLVDRKAQIRVKLQIVTVPTDIQRVHYLSSDVDGAE